MSIGEELKRLRERAGLTQEDIADAARRLGVPWWRATVAKIEAGKREVTAAEFFALRGRPLVQDEWKEFVEKAANPEQPTGITVVKGGGPQTATITLTRANSRGLAAMAAYWKEAELKAAAALRVEPAMIAKGARQLWGRPLSEERDRLVRARLPAGVRMIQTDTGTEIETEAADVKKPTARTIQALRGHVTRELLKELRTVIQPTRRRRR